MDTQPQGYQPPSRQEAPNQDGDELDLLGLVGALIEARWLILLITLLALLVGGTYAVVTQPVYEANTLIQVEESKPGAGSALGEAASLFEIRSPATAEIEILRSRLVVGGAVNDLQLTVVAVPKLLPVVGQWLSRRATELSDPGFMGMPGYVTGSESIKLGALELPGALEGKRLVLVAGENNAYSLFDHNGNPLGQGVVGTPLTLTFSLSPEMSEVKPRSRILVTRLTAKPGGQFYVTHESKQKVISALQRNLTIAEQGRQSGIISVKLQGTDPQRLARTLLAIGSGYVRQNTERKAAEAEKTLVFLGGFLPQIKAQLEGSENLYNKFRNQNSTFDLSNEGKQSLQSSVEIETKLFDLRQKRRELESRFTAEHPSIQVIDQQINAVSREASALTGRIKTLPNLEQDLLRLTRDAKVNNELYASLLNSAQQLRIVKEGRVGNVRVVDGAVEPEDPIKPQRSVIVAVSGLLGLVLGVAIALLRNSLKAGVRDPAEVESATGMHVFATVPRSKAQDALSKAIKAQSPGVHLLSLSAPDDPGVESLRSLRTALQFALLTASNNIVMITGPTPGVGKSFTSANFAALLGAGGKRVLLIDADLRRGHIHQYYGVERSGGLTELITGGHTLAQVLRRSVSTNVDLITTGVLAVNVGELLLLPSLKQLFRSLSTHYDLILVDTPPVLAVSDSQVIAPNAATVFMVMRADISTLSELRESTRRLEQVGVTVKGVIFNDLNLDSRRYRYGYKYSSYQYVNYNYNAKSKALSKR